MDEGKTSCYGILTELSRSGLKQKRWRSEDISERNMQLTMDEVLRNSRIVAGVKF